MVPHSFPVVGRRAVLGLITAGAATVLTGCGRKGSALRYRLTLEIDTPAGVKSGSSVIENVVHAPAMLALPDKFTSSRYGQAPVVDLGGGRFVFALLQGWPFFRYSLSVILKTALTYPEIWPSLQLEPLARDDPFELYSAAQKAMPNIVLRLHDYPELVTFDDVANPQSVRQIDPNSASAILGPGFGIRRVTITVVSRDERISSDFERHFPAISNAKGYFRRKQPGAQQDPSSERHLTSRAFVLRD